MAQHLLHNLRALSENRRLIRSSRIFDGSWYRKEHADMISPWIDALSHYILFGGRRGLSPHPLFDGIWYLRKYSDVAETGLNPLVHYLRWGAAEGRDPNLFFDTDWYLEQYRDVAAAGLNPLTHYIRHGAAEGRNPSPFFDTDWYVGQYRDVACSGMNPLSHYFLYGAMEGRDPSAAFREVKASGIFDSGWYRASYPDIAENRIDALTHYMLFGGELGLSPHPLFDGGWYLRQSPEVGQKGRNPLAHYLTQGASEGRDPSPLFDTDWYLEQYRDVAAAGLNPLSHYILFGADEGRNPSATFRSNLWEKECEQSAKRNSIGLTDFILHGWGRAKRQPARTFDECDLHARAESCSDIEARNIPTAPATEEKQESPQDEFRYGGREAWDRCGRTRLHEILDPAGRRPHLEQSLTPEVSIIVVLFGKAHLTALCIDAIIANCDRPYEVVLVDNGSDDETRLLLERIEGGLILRNKENVGFSKACMQGAAQALGTYLCFLNNDALLQPGSVSSAINNFERDRTVGAVGGKILFANGTLQEAGSILWSDGSAWGVGRGDDPTLPQHNFRRVVDYCSGVFLVTPRSLFFQMGGFDPIYQPAYYEDSDYCLSLSLAGYKILYEPASVVAHYESASSSSIDDAKSLIVSNRLVFIRKWGVQLAAQYFRMSENVLSARISIRAGGMHILYISSEEPPSHGPSESGEDSIRYLIAQGHHVTCIISGTSGSDWKLRLPPEVELIGKVEDLLGEILERCPHCDVIWCTRAEHVELVLKYGRGRGLLRPQLVFDPWARGNQRHRPTIGEEGSVVPDTGPAQLDAAALEAARSGDLVIVRTQSEEAYLTGLGLQNVRLMPQIKSNRNQGIS